MLRCTRIYAIARSKKFSTSIYGGSDDFADPYYDSLETSFNDAYDRYKTKIACRGTFRIEEISSFKPIYSSAKVGVEFRRLSNSSESVGKPLKPRLFYETCKLLKRRSFNLRTPHISALTLAYLPRDCLQLNEERNFVDSYLLPWWYAFEPQINELNNIEVLWKVLTALRRLDQRTNGEVVKLLSYHNLRPIVDHIFDSLSGTNPKSVSTFLACLQVLSLNANAEDKLALKQKLTEFLPDYVLSILENRVELADFADMHIGDILFIAVGLGFEKPSNVCLQHVLSICWRNLHRHFSFSNFFQFANLNRIASTFLYWKIDVDKFSTTFWPKWYSKTSSFLNGPDTFTRAMLLKNCLLVALRYGQENEFNYIRSIWLKKMRCNKQFLPDDCVLFLIEELKNYYQVNSDRDMSSFKDVLAELESCLLK